VAANPSNRRRVKRPTEILCHDCGLAHHRRELAPKEAAHCSRCGATLYEHRPPTVDRALALTIAGLFLFAVANIYPFLGMRMGDTLLETTLISGSIELYDQGKWELAMLVIFTSIVAPGLQLAGLLYVLLPIRLGRVPRYLAPVFRMVDNVVPWSMMDVFILGILVSIVKLAGMATIIPGPALLAFMLLIFVLAWAQSSVDSDRVWSLITVPVGPVGDTGLARLTDCHTCHLTVRLPRENAASARCPRCKAPLHRRKPGSIQRCWALVIAACICYIPANVLPVMYTTSLGKVQGDTIASGALYLFHHGDWPLTLVIFIASIIVPLMKIAILILLLITVQLKSAWRPVDRTRLYRLVEIVGKWSMTDIYVVTVLVALVQMGNLATITAGWGALFFGAVVVLTIFAARSFDPRLIWDRLENGEREYTNTARA